MPTKYSHLTSAALAAILTLTPLLATAHDGRRFRVEIDTTRQLIARGYNSNDRPVDPAGDRDYDNAIHDHWVNSTVGTTASATLPGYDLAPETANTLSGYDLFWTLTGAQQWVVSDPVTSEQADALTIDLQPLDSGIELFARIGTQTPVSTSTPGTLTLVADIADDNGTDLDLLYEINAQPTDTLYLLEAVLSTNAPGIADSETVYSIFSVDGSAFPMAERPANTRHWAALRLEETLGTPVPEPAFMGTTLGVMALTMRRRK
ncbi:MAG: hypothetical protein AAF328_00525 [Planctomycetota bacterium]